MIKANVARIKNEIEEITGKVYEDSGVKIVAASKMQGKEQIEEAIEAGIKDFGENRVQEFQAKYDDFAGRVDFHQIGSLQSNKVKDVIGKVKLIHSLDRESLLKELERRCKKEEIIQDTLIQVNISKEDSKSGLYVDELKPFLDKVEQCDHVRVRGLMTMAPHYEDPEDAAWVFDGLKNLFDEISAIEYNNIKMEFLSMGMTNDYKVALKCGSNMLRIGSDIFGERKY